MLKIVEKKKIWFSLSLAVILVGLVLFFTRGLNFGIDFKGGTLVQIEFGGDVDTDGVDAIISQYCSDASNRVVNDTQYEIKSTELTTDSASEMFTAIQEAYGLEDSALIESETIGATIGKELTVKAVKAVLVACVMMLLYIAIRFKPAFGLAAIIALMHDVLITISVYLIFDITVNSSFIAAILTIVGYSINDTIVVFDRIRENLRKTRRKSATEIADIAISETLSRSINTSLTTLIIIGAVNVFVPAVREFAIPLMVGIAAGSYSSIFIASPIWVLISDFRNRKSKKKEVLKEAKAM